MPDRIAFPLPNIARLEQAKRGDVVAQFQLAEQLRESIPPDYPAAFKWYCLPLRRAIVPLRTISGQCTSMALVWNEAPLMPSFGIAMPQSKMTPSRNTTWELAIVWEKVCRWT